MGRKSFKKRASKLYVLDKDFYPDCWKNNELMSVFFDTFRPRQDNEAQYDEKMKFWKDMIENYCDYKGSPQFDHEELGEAFKRNGTKPYCLKEVFNQMQSDGTLVSKDEFMQQPKSLVARAVDSFFVKPLSCGFKKMKETLVNTKFDDKKIFVSKAAVKKQSQLLLGHIRRRRSFNNIISMDDLMDEADDIEGISRDGILVVLHHLSTNDRKVYIDGTDRLLKFSEPYENVKAITDMERSIYNLGQKEKSLAEKEEGLEDLLGRLRNVEEGRGVNSGAGTAMATKRNKIIILAVGIAVVVVLCLIVTIVVVSVKINVTVHNSGLASSKGEAEPEEVKPPIVFSNPALGFGKPTIQCDIGGFTSSGLGSSLDEARSDCVKKIKEIYKFYKSVM